MFDMKIVLAVAMVAFFVGSVQAEPYRTMAPTPSSNYIPDIPVTSSATKQVLFPGQTKYIYLKNDCATDMYFDLTGKNIFPLRLAQDQSVSLPFQVNSVTASPAVGATATCTFTLLGGK